MFSYMIMQCTWRALCVQSKHSNDNAIIYIIELQNRDPGSQIQKNNASLLFYGYCFIFEDIWQNLALNRHVT